MASIGHGQYVVVVLYVGGSKAPDIKLVLQREPRTSKTWFLAGSILPNGSLLMLLFASYLRKLALL
jgi:hypothetical protein